MRLLLRSVPALAISIAMVGIAAPAHADGRIVTIGDSVMLGAKWQLQRNGVIVDAAKSRFPRAGVSVIRSKSGRSDVVIHLGTNGQLIERDCQAMVRAASKAERVYLVTIAAPRDYAKRNNAVIRKCASAFPATRVFVIDWAQAAAAHPSWLYSDGIHLRPEGAKGFTRLILGSVKRARAGV
jgi:lysophospholipase L1-like esterase